jgi:phenylalanyl-tRNA synthetase beta chain
VAGVISHKTASFSEAKSVVESLLRNLGVRWRIEELSYPCFIEGRAASVRIGKRIIGMFGEIHPQVLKNWRLEMPVGAFELDVESLA